MGLSAEEKKQLEALTAKSKEPDAPSANLSYHLPLDSDAAWDRAVKLGLVREPQTESESKEEEEEAPKRNGYFGDK